MGWCVDDLMVLQFSYVVVIVPTVFTVLWNLFCVNKLITQNIHSFPLNVSVVFQDNQIHMSVVLFDVRLLGNNDSSVGC